jgi:hypothetical protein
MRELPVQGQQHIVDDQEPVLSVSCDPADLIGREPQIQGVQDTAGGWYAEIAFQVGMVVPAKRGNPVALGEAERLQCGCQRSRAAVVLAEAVPPQALVGQA